MYSSCKKADAAKLESVQNDALRIIAGAKRFTSNFLLLNETGFQTLGTRRDATQYQDSLFPKCTQFFNTQDPNFRSSEYTAQLNHFRKKCNKLQNGYYLMGSRFVQVVLSQLRLRFSNLNEHLFSKGCIDSPRCRCSGLTWLKWRTPDTEDWTRI